MTEEQLSNEWKKSRSGAWAHRGFHYQHLIVTLIALRQWAGLAPNGFVVPEGFEDCVIELEAGHVRVQVKSRREGSFGESEVRDILATMAVKATSGAQINARCVVALEQNRQGVSEKSLEALFEPDLPDVIVCKSPETEIIELLSSKLRVAEIIVEGIASDIYRLVAEAATFNAAASYENRRRLSPTEIEKRINELLAAQDPSAIDDALLSGTLRGVDFTTPLNEPGFYLGTKVQPGHIAAGLVVPRPSETNGIIKALRARRQVVLSAPSGAGKSALLWLAAGALAGEVRWLQVSSSATVNDVAALMRFVHSRRPSDKNLIGLVFDDLDPSNADLWNVLSQDLRAAPGVYLFASARRENIELLTARSEIGIVDVKLDGQLAETVWTKLRADAKTSWEHWREAFEQSNGLMLEYVHILTQGHRLSEVVTDQIRLREREGREDELSIIRCTSAIFSRNGEIEVARLVGCLGIPATTVGRALRRLMDEHLVRESRPGILGGLHALRSAALLQASHDEAVYLSSVSLWKGLGAASIGTVPQIVRSLFSDLDDAGVTEALKQIAQTLHQSNDFEYWSATLDGLGLASLEEHARTFIAVLEEHGVPKANWSIAAMFSDPKLDIPKLSGNENWDRFQKSILAFRAAPKRDLRGECLDLLPTGVGIPPCTSLRDAAKLFASLAPLNGGTPIKITMAPEIAGDGEPDIKELSTMLAAAYHIDPHLAASLVKSFGGEDALLAAFHRQTPWVTEPAFEAGKHGRTIRSNWFLLAEDFQTEPHKTVCDICDTLIALTPSSEAAASDAVNAEGAPIRVGAYATWSKNMPRENIPAPSRVSWNRAFNQIVTARSSAGTLTSYAGEMADLVARTEKIFRTFSETWIKGKQVKDAQVLAEGVNDILGRVNDLAYAGPKELSPPGSTAESISDTLGALLTGILGNLIGRMNKVTAESGVKATAAFAADLAEQARSHANSAIWRTVPNPPMDQLRSLARRLADVASILREFGEDSSPVSVQTAIKVAGRADLGKAVQTTARRSRTAAEQRMTEVLGGLESALRQSGIHVQCITRPFDKYSAFWPAKEVAILVSVENFDDYNSGFEAVVALGREYLKRDWMFRIVPKINSKIIAPLAMNPTSELTLPDLQFEEEWCEHIDMPFVSTVLVQNFEKLFAASLQASGIFLARGVVTLHAEEDEVLSQIIDSFQRQRQALEEAASNGAEHRLLALEYADQLWSRLVGEFDDLKAGLTIAEPLCMSPHKALTGKIDQTAAEVAFVKFQILEGEARGPLTEVTVR
ncbi:MULTISPECIES: hypothetical protein [Rhizobium/Agrobacterium group]|uniref:hypothetical protein n=1 Tax=Rhizobium/Agrobacterium group TaxID=227290 RepID=UPI0003F1CCA3|nr:MULTISPECIES: hypothetical protein [Rhizobium/Agrobacterium group]AHK04647.1 hypothetical protein X971_4808 [Agrobacterium tumefaciens LBA4213 (Ach5)]AKC10376.1 hypothetical protein Ach5_46050 [Agrobacterium tumefaciens]AYM19522.1 hypothetical protein At15955_45370 [Agrobacterium tumefaciens]AYM70823.1 hypothetical protein AtA6_46070 [Agrobacterium tumefaciens]NIB59447.1 hypothetical protein [Agrobacterium tumefaciens]